MQAARNTIMKGTEVCSKNEDVWLEAIRLQVCKQFGTHTWTASNVLQKRFPKFLALLLPSSHCRDTCCSNSFHPLICPVLFYSGHKFLSPQHVAWNLAGLNSWSWIRDKMTSIFTVASCAVLLQTVLAMYNIAMHQYPLVCISCLCNMHPVRRALSLLYVPTTFIDQCYLSFLVSVTIKWYQTNAQSLVKGFYQAISYKVLSPL